MATELPGTVIRHLWALAVVAWFVSPLGPPSTELKTAARFFDDASVVVALEPQPEQAEDSAPDTTPEVASLDVRNEREHEPAPEDERVAEVGEAPSASPVAEAVEPEQAEPTEEATQSEIATARPNEQQHLPSESEHEQDPPPVASGALAGTQSVLVDPSVDDGQSAVVIRFDGAEVRDRVLSTGQFCLEPSVQPGGPPALRQRLPSGALAHASAPPGFASNFMFNAAPEGSLTCGHLVRQSVLDEIEQQLNALPTASRIDALVLSETEVVLTRLEEGT